MIWQGQNKEALPLLLAELPSSLTATDVAINQSLLLGLAYARLGRFAESDQSLQKAISLCGRYCPLLGELARARGVIAVQHGDLESARAMFLQSLQSAQEQADIALETSALVNLGYVATAEEHYDESIDWTEQARKIAQANDFGLDQVKALGNLGWAYQNLGDFEQALALYLEAERRASTLNATTDKVIWLTRIGDVYTVLGRLSEAEDNYEVALRLAKQNENAQRIADIATSLAFVSVENGRLNEATEYSEEAIKLARAARSRLYELYPLLASAEVDAHLAKLEEAKGKFLEISRDHNSDVFLRWASEDELAKLCQQKHMPREAGEHFQVALKIFENARSTLHGAEHKLPFLANADRLYEDYINFLIENGEVGKALQLADFGRAQTLEEGLGVVAKTARHFPGTLDPRSAARRAGGTILFYRLGSKQSYVWAVTPNSVHVYPLPPAKVIDAAVKNYGRGILGLRDVLETDGNDGTGLYKTLIAPADHVIARNSRVFIIPDGSLNTLNFETLIVPGAKPHYWIDDVSVIDAYSLRLLGGHRSGSKATTKLLLLGNAVTPNSEYPELRNASVEMNYIAKHFASGDRQIFSGEQANPSAYLESRPQEFDYIHFVAHGTASRLDPLDSAVVLSRSGTAEESFKLYARDIIKHPVQATLVTVSTCYGAGSRAYTGEGLVGLAWAFLHAGAHNVIGALWQVSDDSTPQLMDRLYAELRKNLPPDSALREAKLSLLHSQGVFRKPFYWAPFQLYAGS